MFSAEHLSRSPRSGLGRRVLVGTAGAVVGVGVCFLVASLTGAALTVAVGDTGATPVPFGAAVFATAAAGGGAYALARLALRAARPRRRFLLLTTAGLLASAVPPLQAATTTATAIWLLIMHTAVAVVLLPVVASRLPSRRPAGPEVARPALTPVAGPATAEGNS